jgi:uncharacterized protein
MYKILSIDGGGIKGVFPLAFLSGIEETLDNKIGDYFDLIVGTSTGGIIALGLGLGYSAKELLEFYERLGPKVFVPKKKNIISSFFNTKYDSTNLEKELQDLFGDKRLGESNTRLVIPSYNLDRREPHVYKTSHNERLQMDYKVKVVDVALATAAAPTYFSSHETEHGIYLVDGGVYANNPTGLAVVEAMTLLGWKPEEFKVLSIGCTNELIDTKNLRNKGKAFWATKVSETFMSAQSSQSMGTAYLLANSREHNNIYRIDQTVLPGKFKLDGVEKIKELRGLGISNAREQLPKLKKIFFEELKQESFIPFYKL